MTSIIENICRAVGERVSYLLLSRKEAGAHRIGGIQARFIVARPGAGSLARLTAEQALLG